MASGEKNAISDEGFWAFMGVSELFWGGEQYDKFAAMWKRPLRGVDTFRISNDVIIDENVAKLFI